MLLFKHQKTAKSPFDLFLFTKEGRKLTREQRQGSRLRFQRQLCRSLLQTGERKILRRTTTIMVAIMQNHCRETLEVAFTVLLQSSKAVWHPHQNQSRNLGQNPHQNGPGHRRRRLFSSGLKEDTSASTPIKTQHRNTTFLIYSRPGPGPGPGSVYPGFPRALAKRVDWKLHKED